ncbi:MAG: carboxypeptidase-like regulatory domain-containing protein, partial [Flavobacterium sp.]
MKKLVISMLFVLQVVFAWAQERTASVTGKVVDSKSQRPLENVVVTIQNTTLTALTNKTGVFVFEKVVVGNQLLEVNSNGYARQLLSIDVTEGTVLDLGSIMFEEDITSEQQLSLITITENDLGDDNSGSESTAGLLQASRDAYQQAAAFNWGQARFRIRGLDNEYGKTMINGVSMDKIYDGRPQYSNWGGLNDATRNQEFTNGSTPSDYTFGGPLGTQEINTRASIYRPGTRISFSGTNTNYNFRTMATHASGMDRNGWAYVISASRRWAEEGFFEGTDYAANSFFASVEKKINDNHSLNITSIYAQNSRGKNSPNTKEVTDLMGTEYNSYWGYQNGKKRNSRDKDVEEPIFILSHYWKINDKTNLNTSVSYQFGSIANSRFDFNNANNPDPVYYRNLPSYFGSLNPQAFVWNPNTDQYLASGDAYQSSKSAWENGDPNVTQINWNRLYAANMGQAPISQYGANGKRALYYLVNDVSDDKVWNAATHYTYNFTDKAKFMLNVSYQNYRSELYREVNDLLGADFVLNRDPFAATNNPGTSALYNEGEADVAKKVGDKLLYNYIFNRQEVKVNPGFKFSEGKFDVFVSGLAGYSTSSREGLFKHYLYADSFGKSKDYDFWNFGL